MSGALRARCDRDLAWGEVLECFARRACSEEARQALRGIGAPVDPEDLRPHRDLLEDALTLANRLGGSVPVAPVRPIESTVEAVRRGTVAQGVELAEVRRSLDAAAALGRWSHTLPAELAALRAAFGAGAPEPLRGELERCLDADGHLTDVASPALGRARRRATEARQAVERRLDELVREWGPFLRERWWTSREGRFALPVRSDALRDVDGWVLGASASGSTLYVEPREIAAFTQRLALAVAEREREEAACLGRLSAAVAERSDEVRAAHERALLADRVAATVAVARAWDASLLTPRRGAGLSLRRLRHPLLVERGGHVVASDVELGRGECLVISGPNAGGKTVTLEAVGLAARLASVGLPVPAAEGSDIGWYSVATDIGDHQSLARALSTFSAELVHLGMILEHATPELLVLLDEVAAGTDPEEGAALAQAVLEALVERGATVLVTTHHERLRDLHARHPRFHAASVGFSLETLEPTFGLQLGVPGPSTALAVAARFGLPRAVVDRAAELIPALARERESLVRRLAAEVERAQRAAEQEHAAAIRREAEAAEAEQERVARERAHTREMERHARELMARLRLARLRLHAAERRLESAGARAELAEASRGLDRAQHELAIGGPVDRRLRGQDSPPPPSAAALAPGQAVQLVTLGATGEVLERLQGDRVRVLVGGMKLVVAESELALAPRTRPARGRSGRRTAAPRAERPAGAMSQGGEPPLLRTRSNVLDVRGRRVEEARAEVDRFLDALLSAGERGGFLLHGHGTGALKSALRDHLAGLSFVARVGPASPEDGGDALTRFELAG